MITKEATQEVIDNYGKSEEDSGSTEVQIAIFTKRIGELTEHLKDHPTDHASRQGLIRLVGKRRRLLNYLQSEDIEKYRELISDLNIRK
jgi:small subunit ribosomal protein S15